MSKTFEEIKNTDDLNSLTPIEYCIWFTSVGASKQFSVQAAAELAALRERLARVEAEQAQEVDEFNAGYEAYKADLDLDNAEAMYRAALPDDVPSHDVFGVGYAWAKFTTEREAAALKGGQG